MATKTINISLDEELLKKIDEAAKAEYASRSDYIRTSLVKNLRATGADDAQVIKTAKKILADYKQDFQNLAER